MAKVRPRDYPTRPARQLEDLSCGPPHPAATVPPAGDRPFRFPQSLFPSSARISRIVVLADQRAIIAQKSRPRSWQAGNRGKYSKRFNRLLSCTSRMAARIIPDRFARIPLRGSERTRDSNPRGRAFALSKLTLRNVSSSCLRNVRLRIPCVVAVFRVGDLSRFVVRSRRIARVIRYR